MDTRKKNKVTLTLFGVLEIERITRKQKKKQNKTKQTNKQGRHNHERYSTVQLVLKLSKNYEFV